jgi:CRISPR-associated protein Csx10
VRIGRSRNTEFGRVELKIQNIDALPKPKNLGNRLVLWCLSDSELLDENGFPTLSPRVESIHPDLAGTLDFQHSFINNARISRFNQKRHGMDGEQLVISKGSVLVYQLDAKPDDQVLAEISQKGIGLNRQQGLGWVSVNPAWAEKSRLDSQNLFVPIYIQPDITAQTREVSTALIGWVKERVSANNTINQTQERVNSLLKEICIAYQNARHYNNILISNEAGPSSTQWRRIANEVRTSNEQWSVCVFSGNQPICKADNDELGWGIQWHNGEVLTNFAVHTRAKIANESVTTMRLLLEQLCRYVLSTFQGLKKIAKELHLDRDSQ